MEYLSKKLGNLVPYILWSNSILLLFAKYTTAFILGRIKASALSSKWLDLRQSCGLPSCPQAQRLTPQATLCCSLNISA